MSARMFPIMTDGRDIEAVRKVGGLTIVVCLPWAMMLEHQAQALKNHDQTILTLANRCGLSPCEALAVLEDRDWREMPIAECHSKLKDKFNDWWAMQQAGSK